jgi:DNA polymerase II small subunit
MEQRLLNKKDLVYFFLKKGFLLSSDVLDNLQKEEDFDKIHSQILDHNLKEISVLSTDTKKILDTAKKIDVNWEELDKLKVLFEKGKNKENYLNFVNYFLSKTLEDNKKPQDEYNVKIISSYEVESKKREAKDFTYCFYNRYMTLAKILQNRQELKNITSINRILGKKDRESISIIGLVSDKHTTKNNNIMLTLEDKTGLIKVLVNKNKPTLHRLAKDIVLDDVVAVVGVNGENIIFANNIVLPDIPNTNEVKKTQDEVYALFLSDMHVGSIDFLEDDFNKFLKWINCEIGNEEQRKIASKVKYIFLIGDLVDGCGIYPGQDKELLIKDVREQYEACARLLKKIPENIHLIICPGNHDAIRVAEPQPPMYRDFAESIYNLQNAIMVSNPSMVNIHSSENFSGFDVLLYHGYSFDYYVAQVDSLRNSGGYDRADLIMKFLLQRRHLAPTHTSTLYIPDPNKDPLVIEQVPDFFVSGHIHKSITSNYRNVTMICSSCWQSKTAFQEKVGHNPEPSRVPIVNLQTREVKILKFGN